AAVSVDGAMGSVPGPVVSRPDLALPFKEYSRVRKPRRVLLVPGFAVVPAASTLVFSRAALGGALVSSRAGFTMKSDGTWLTSTSEALAVMSSAPLLGSGRTGGRAGSVGSLGPGPETVGGAGPAAGANLGELATA